MWIFGGYGYNDGRGLGWRRPEHRPLVLLQRMTRRLLCRLVRPLVHRLAGKNEGGHREEAVNHSLAAVLVGDGPFQGSKDPYRKW